MHRPRPANIPANSRDVQQTSPGWSYPGLGRRLITAGPIAGLMRRPEVPDHQGKVRVTADRLVVIGLKGTGIFPVRFVVDRLVTDPAARLDLGASLPKRGLDHAPAPAAQLSGVDVNHPPYVESHPCSGGFHWMESRLSPTHQGSLSLIRLAVVNNDRWRVPTIVTHRLSIR